MIDFSLMCHLTVIPAASGLEIYWPSKNRPGCHLPHCLVPRATCLLHPRACGAAFCCATSCYPTATCHLPRACCAATCSCCDTSTFAASFCGTSLPHLMVHHRLNLCCIILCSLKSCSLILVAGTRTTRFRTLVVACAAVIGLCLMLYIPTGILGYMIFGDDTQSDILENFDSDR